MKSNIASTKEELRQEILEKTVDYYRLAHQQEPFISGESKLPYAGRIFDEKELMNLVDSSLEFWLTHGRYSRKFEKDFAKFLGIKHCAVVNSGSSANLVAFMALTSENLGEKRIKKGDEVITVAAGFPTTITPIIQFGAIPVFLDIDIETLNIDVNQLETALSSRTRAVMLAHTLGNPFNLDVVRDFCNKNNLWLIEDNCDALGSEYDGKYTGTFGDIATSSFYPPHHITMGEGGAVYTNNNQLYKNVNSLRDWGRDCWCPSGKDNTCGKRFSHQLGELLPGYDHKYTYSHFGYNFKATEMQAAIGCAQLEKLPIFIKKRRGNFQMLYDGLYSLNKHFIYFRATDKSDPSWFGFLLTVRDDAAFTRDDIVRFLENAKIQTRMLFAGNIIKQPCFNSMRQSGKGFRVCGDLINTDLVMNNSFWIGVYPGMTKPMIQYIITKIKEFVS